MKEGNNELLHTFSNLNEVKTTYLNWIADVNFDKKQISGTASWHFINTTKANKIVFDTYDLQIEEVKINDKIIAFSLGEKKDYMGQALTIPIAPNDSMVEIKYTTGASATALQWLTAEQTAGKKMPYLFTQCESINARSMIPCMDDPSNRITYNATISVPKGMMALMSAKNPQQKSAVGIYSFDMEIPIPTYLIALAVGDIEFKKIDDRTGVYTEPINLQKCATELSDIPNMMLAAEKIVGPYKWGRYDVLVAPPSFPIGGMENPRLTFATPTIIAGDKSLVSLIAHEMAHSWSGNLVTNSNWNDLWLNEGFTTYVERRIMEQITDTSYSNMLWQLGFQDMQSDLDAMGDTSMDTRLQIDLKGRDPENGFSNIPYEKGALFLKLIEEKVGREKFDIYMNNYFQKNSFIPMNTAKALAYMRTELFKNDQNKEKEIGIDEWVFKPGKPANCPNIVPGRFIAVNDFRTTFLKNGIIDKQEKEKTSKWTTHEWLQFLRKLPRPLDIAKMKVLDNTFGFTKSTNAEIADEWYLQCILSNYKDANTNIDLFLNSVGRKKFLTPLYSALCKTPEGKKLAQAIFEKAKNKYHPLTTKKMAELVK
jgi:leukotriene A-4 hydrolase/aminopeptidase